MKNQKKTTQKKHLKSKINFTTSFFTLALALFIASCANAQREDAEQSASRRYSVKFVEINPHLTKDVVSGEANFTLAGDNIKITLQVRGVAPHEMHMQHVHGFILGGGGAFRIPPPEADTNHDGVIDLIETYDYSGKTLIPLNDAPAD